MARCARCAALAVRARAARGALRSGRGGRRGRLAPCRGYETALVWVGDLVAIGYRLAPHERPGRSYCPLRGHPARGTLAGRPRLPPVTLGAEMGGSGRELRRCTVARMATTQAAPLHPPTTCAPTGVAWAWRRGHGRRGASRAGSVEAVGREVRRGRGRAPHTETGTAHHKDCGLAVMPVYLMPRPRCHDLGSSVEE
jgi:hypothetical protein